MKEKHVTIETNGPIADLVLDVEFSQEEQRDLKPYQLKYLAGLQDGVEAIAEALEATSEGYFPDPEVWNDYLHRTLEFHVMNRNLLADTWRKLNLYV